MYVGREGLATVDVNTGTATELGPTGTCSPSNGLAFANADVLYHSDVVRGGTLYTLDQAMGAATVVATLSFVGFPSATVLRVNTMSFEPATDVLYASVNAGGGSSGLNFLATVDPTTGVVTNVGQSVSGLRAIAWHPIRDPQNTGECKSDKSGKSGKSGKSCRSGRSGKSGK